MDFVLNICSIVTHHSLNRKHGKIPIYITGLVNSKSKGSKKIWIGFVNWFSYRFFPPSFFSYQFKQLFLWEMAPNLITSPLVIYLRKFDLVSHLIFKFTTYITIACHVFFVQELLCGPHFPLFSFSFEKKKKV